MKASTPSRRRIGGALLTTLLAAAAIAGGPLTGAYAQKASAPMATKSDALPAPIPTSVLLFPAITPSDAGTGHPVAEGIVTDAIRRYLNKASIGTVVYSRRLPAVERAVVAGELKQEDAKGPGDDPRKAKSYAEMLGANEYLTVTIDDYKFDPATRTVTFNLSVSRNASDGTSLSVVAQKAVGTAPADIPASRQEAFAVSSASDVAGEQTVEAAYPGAAARINPPKEAPKKKRHGIGSLLIPAAAVVGAIIGKSS